MRFFIRNHRAAYLLLSGCVALLWASACTQDSGVGSTLKPEDTGPASNDEILQAGVVMGSCFPDDGIGRNLSYLWNWREQPHLFWVVRDRARCLAHAGGGCAALKKCLGYEVRPTTAPDAAASRTGNVFSFSQNGYQISIDCNVLHTQCNVKGGCSATPVEACDDASYENHCEADGRALFCAKGHVTTGPDCAALGLACVAGYCRGSGDVCTGDPANYQGMVYYHGLSCDGNQLNACVDGKRHVRDCAGVAPGMACQQVGDRFFCGFASECLPGEEPTGHGGTATKCDGTTAVICNAGRVERVDCTALGFTGCAVGGGNYGCIPSHQ